MSSKVSDRKETEIPLKISAGRKIHALDNNNLRSDPPKRSQTEKKVGKAQLINKMKKASASFFRITAMKSLIEKSDVIHAGAYPRS